MCEHLYHGGYMEVSRQLVYHVDFGHRIQLCGRKKEFKWRYSTIQQQCFFQTLVGQQINSPMQSMSYLLLNCWPIFRNPLKLSSISCCHCFWILSKTSWQDPFAEHTTYLGRGGGVKLVPTGSLISTG